MVVDKAREILQVFNLVWFTLGNAWGTLVLPTHPPT